MTASKRRVVKSYPERIWLQHDPECTGEPFCEAHEVTWCRDKINDNDVEYVRKDIAARALAAQPNPHIETDDCGFDRNASISEGKYVCNCGWSEASIPLAHPNTDSRSLSTEQASYGIDNQGNHRAPSVPEHTNHPVLEEDGACPACIAEGQHVVPDAMPMQWQDRLRNSDPQHITTNGDIKTAMLDELIELRAYAEAQQARLRELEKPGHMWAPEEPMEEMMREGADFLPVTPGGATNKCAGSVYKAMLAILGKRKGRAVAAAFDTWFHSPYRRKHYDGSLDVEALEWAIALLERHPGVQANPNSRMWLDRLKANLHHYRLDLEGEKRANK